MSVENKKVVEGNTCKHTWDKITGIWNKGIAHIGIKGKWVRTCTSCGHKESFSKGIFNGWFTNCLHRGEGTSKKDL